MKKALSFLMLLLVLTTCVFASQRVSVTLDPFSFQHFVQSKEDSKKKVNSKYGIGGGIDYRYEYDNGYMLGADIKADSYTIEGQGSFTDVSLFAKAGYSLKTDEIASIFADMKLGLDIQTHSQKTSAVFEFGPELGAVFNFNEKYHVLVYCEALFGFPSKEGIKYSELRVTPTIGVGYTF